MESDDERANTIFCSLDLPNFECMHEQTSQRRLATLHAIFLKIFNFQPEMRTQCTSASIYTEWYSVSPTIYIYYYCKVIMVTVNTFTVRLNFKYQHQFGKFTYIIFSLARRSVLHWFCELREQHTR